MPVVLETEQLHLLCPWLGLSQPWCLLIRARSDHGRERAKVVGTTLRSSPLRRGFSIQPPSPLSMQAQKPGHSHHHDEEKLTGAAAAYGRAPKAKKFATCEKAEPRDGLPVVPTLVRVEPEFCYGGIRKLPIPNSPSGNQEVQSLRSLHGRDSVQVF